MTKMSEEIKVRSSSGNIFADLGLANSSELLIKAELVRQISELITVAKLTRIEAAKCLGIDRSKITDLLRGKLSEFSIDRLFRFLNALGSDVEIRAIAKPESDSDAKTRVIAI
jgi:predicted XRE-type DNA-binding protein